MKEILLNQMAGYIDCFADFGECNNSIIVSGSLDYLRIVLENEKFDFETEHDLLELITDYVGDVKRIHDLCGGNPKVFEYMNLSSLENKFNRIWDYMSQELGLFQDYRGDDLEIS